MEFDASTRIDFDRDPETVRLRERLAAKRDELEKFCARSRLRRKRTANGSRVDRAAVVAAARRADVDLREHLAQIAERATDLRLALGGSAADAVVAAIDHIGREREREAQRRALRGTVAFERTESRGTAATEVTPW